MEFIAREKELALMEKAIENPNFDSVLLYGRRRVGKTELIRQALKKAQGRIIVFSAGKTLYSNNFATFVDCLSSAYSLPLHFSNLHSALDFIGIKAKEEKTILVLDEYSYFRDGDGMVDSDLQSFIDSYQHDSHLTLILSGSIVRVMKSFFDARAPLYGRMKTLICLEPFSYYDAARFYPERSPEEKMELYACFGGIPHYLLLLDPHQSVEDNIIRLFFSLNSVLRNEADDLLSDELSAIDNANAVLSLIAGKSLHYAEINQLYPDSRGNGATYILKRLTEMSFLKKSMAINARDERNAAYEIADPFLRFYFTFLVPTRSYSLLYEGKDLYLRFIRQSFHDAYLPRIFEEVAREFLIKENKAGHLEPPLIALGSYAYSAKEAKSGKRVNGQFDVVGQDEKGFCDYECKYTKKPLTLKEVLVEKESIVHCGVPFERVGFFSRSGFTPALRKQKEIPCYSLDDIYR